MSPREAAAGLPGWSDLRHGGLLLDAQRQSELAARPAPPRPSPWRQSELRRQIELLRATDPVNSSDRSGFVSFVLEEICGFEPGPEPERGSWLRGSRVPADWRRRALTGETVRPRQLWLGPRGAVLPVFVTDHKRLGIGRGRRETSRVLGWLRAGAERLALVTNGSQWRLLFAGLDFDAWCEWDTELWFADGAPTPALDALCILIQPGLWTPAENGADPPLLQAVRDSRKGQSELSEALGERVREAVELLIRSHGEALKQECANVDPADIYRAACRVIMRLVVILFAEARGLLPRDDAVYHDAYGLGGIQAALRRRAASGRLQRHGHGAWPRLLALFNLVREGSHHPDLPVPAYGGDLFAPGSPEAEEDGAEDGLSRALAAFETACLRDEALPDAEVHELLERLTRTRVRIRQGRASRWVSAPVDFSDLSTEYIGVLYEGLLDYELKTAPSDDSVIFLAVGEQPALPLARLEAMDDKALKRLFESLGKARSGGGGAGEAPDETPEAAGEEDAAGSAPETADNKAIQDSGLGNAGIPQASGAENRSGRQGARLGVEPCLPPGVQRLQPHEPSDAGDVRRRPTDDLRLTTRTRAEEWARRAALAAGLVRKPRRSSRQAALRPAHEEALRKTASRLVSRVVLPGEWYLVRWGGTRKGSGSFYTRPGLTVPTVQRTLRPLAYDAPPGPDGEPDRDAPPARWTPKPPEQILDLKVCDPACGSGSFPLAALRFLTDALYASLQHHRRIEARGSRALVRLLGLDGAAETGSAGLPTGILRKAPGASSTDDLVPGATPGVSGATPGAPGATPGVSGTSTSLVDGAAQREAAGAVERPGDELIPCPPHADDFEPRLRAVLRRYVVERCIYGVDVDPLAVSLCQLSLWIETMDRDLPFSFLDHKIRCGNSLIGAWFDQFQHYPAMAWKNREAGDKNHSNGVHFQKGAQTKAIKAFVKDDLTPDLRHMLEGRTLFHEDLLEQSTAVHGAALEALERMHRLPIHDSAARARLYREELLGSDRWRSLKQAMDLWCACWFWPADELDCAPLPTAFTAPAPGTRAVAARVAAEMRFFHWELEFPDVFREPGSGFDAMLGNPPWDIAKPKSQEFFSNIDPLYRSYGKQQAVRRQSEYFTEDPAAERAWLSYSARFRAQSNFMACAASPFGDPEENDKSQRRFAAARGKANLHLHDRWREARSHFRGYADAEHSFRHQGSADLNLYKLFLEQTHALLKGGGRLGFVVPSGLYSDQGTGALRDLFLERCSWEWLFGFENRAKLFPIDSRFKFNPVIVQKGGETAAIRTVFMRRDLTDWEHADDFAVPYSREQVLRFSPKSRAILEIESQRDLEVLEKIYKGAVLLGDDSPDGWGIRYATEFHMTNDSKLFPPRPEWEAKGYRPDEYSRWLLGAWRPIDELWAELGIDPDRPEPAAIELEDWLFDCEAGPERRMAERRFVHGHVLAPGDLEATGWETRCAQPPYDRLPVPRNAIPAGIILSREANAWIHETEIEDVALPLYQGIMVQPFMPSARGWLSGTGLRAKWDYNTPGTLVWNPQYLIEEKTARERLRRNAVRARIGYRDIARSTDTRSFIGAVLPQFPCGNKVPVLCIPASRSTSDDTTYAGALLNSFIFDWLIRRRLGGTTINWHVLQETVLPMRRAGSGFGALSMMTSQINLSATPFAPLRLDQAATPLGKALSPAERLRTRAVIDAVSASMFGCDPEDLSHLLHSTDLPSKSIGALSSAGDSLDARGFWRVDKDKPPELRHTVLTQIAFADLQHHIEAANGDREAGIRAFMTQSHGEGWRLPETLRLADYGLGHDHRAREHQPVATELGPRFHDWQLAQPPEEAWAETHLHARNLLGEHAYRRLLADLDRRQADRPETAPFPDSQVAEPRHRWDHWLDRTDEDPKPRKPADADQTDLFDTE